MSVFVWKHGMRRSDARKQMELRLVNAGYADKVIWRDDSFHAVIGWGSVLDLAGFVDDDSVVIEKSNGLIGGAVLAKTQTTLRDIFPVDQIDTFNHRSPDGSDDSGLSCPEATWSSQNSRQNEDETDEASFPASDPPSRTPISHVGAPIK